MQIDNEKYAEFVQRRETQDEIWQNYRRKSYSVHHLNSGKFGLFIRFQKNIYKVFRKLDLRSPIAIRLFLYFIEHNIEYEADPKSEIPFNASRLMRECNIRNGKSFYEGIQYLQSKSLIFLIEKEDRKIIKVNTSILLWNVDENIKMKIYQKELDRLTTPSE